MSGWFRSYEERCRRFKATLEHYMKQAENAAKIEVKVVQDPLDAVIIDIWLRMIFQSGLIYESGNSTENNT